MTDADVDVLVDDGVDADADALTADALAVLAALGLDAPELCVRLTDDDTIRALNAEYRDKDTATDVLSFPQQDGDVVGGLLGDMVISVPTATRQAAELGHDLHTELRVLLVHGIAHLLGHDHHDDDEAAAMREVERRGLAALGTAASAGLIERAGAV